MVIDKSTMMYGPDNKYKVTFCSLDFLLSKRCSRFLQNITVQSHYGPMFVHTITHLTESLFDEDSKVTILAFSKKLFTEFPLM